MTFQEKILQNPFRLFVVVSILFHLCLMAMLAVRWPKMAQAVSRSKPMFVDVIDPAQLFQLPVEKETVLPPKPKDIAKGDLVSPPPSPLVVPRPSAPRSSKPPVQSKPAPKPNPTTVPELSEAHPAAPAPLPDVQPQETPSNETTPSESNAPSTPQDSLTPAP